MTLQEDHELYAVAIAFGLGIVSYFALAFEPPLIMAMVMLVLTIAFFARFRDNHKLYQTGVLLIAIALGFSAATFQTMRTNTAFLPADESFYPLEATVAEVIINADGDTRLVVSDVITRDLGADETPTKLSILVRTEMPDLRSGDRISLNAVLAAPSAALYPGGFDFARNSWFKQLGGSGFAASPITLLTPRTETGLSTISIRETIKTRLEAGLDDPAAKGLAIALSIGDKSLIPEETIDAMRDAGLAHVLAISGLHMGLITATIFFVIEALLALSAKLTLRMPPQKIAAVVAWCGALIYLTLSGGAVSTVRAFIMVSVVLLAVLMDRRALSLRSVAIAALLIMIVDPASLLSVSFQMSFAAVTALIIVYDRYGRTLIFGGRGKGLTPLQKFAGFILATLATTFVAEAAIAPFALYHFQSVVLYGLIANVVVIPIVTFWVMPLILLTLIAMPFGLEGMILPLLGAGLSAVNDVAIAVSSTEGATAEIFAQSSEFLLFALVGAFAFVIIRSWQGGVVLAAMVLLMVVTVANSEPYDGFINEKATAVALRDGETLKFMSARQSFAKENWLQASATGPNERKNLSRMDRDCMAGLCTYYTDDGTSIIKVKSLGEVMRACGKVDIIVAPNVRVTACRSGSLIIDSSSLSKGNIGLRRTDVGWRMETTKNATANRPWHQ